MAAAQYTPLCGCGRPLKVFRSGKLAQRCSVTCKPKCGDCGALISLGAKQCRDCKDATAREASQARRQRLCEGCGAPFVKKPNRRGSDGERYCSRACYFEATARTTAVRQAERAARSAAYQARLDAREPPFSSVWFRACNDCGAAYVARRQAQVRCCECACATKQRRAPSDKACAWCGTTFRGLSHVRFCGQACRRACNKKREKALRRKRESAACEDVNPYAVFDRDGWRCMMCGKATPKERRGTNYANAPELDHVVPLALGGSHTYANVQCACRSCNGRKGARMVPSQMPLFAGACQGGGGGSQTP